MCVHVRPELTQIAVLEGRSLIEHYVCRPADDVGQIHGNIYLGKVQNVLPGMEAAFVDIGTPKNAVLYRGDVQYDAEDIVEKGTNARIEQMLKARSRRSSARSRRTRSGPRAPGSRKRCRCRAGSWCSSPTRRTYGISKRLPDDERKRLRGDPRSSEARRARRDRAHRGRRASSPRRSSATCNGCCGSGSRSMRSPSARRRRRCSTASPTWPCGSSARSSTRTTAASSSTTPRCTRRCATTWRRSAPSSPTASSTTTREAEGLPLFERHHVHEQLHKALDRKVWLPSGGSLIIEHTEALTVIDVNTGKNVGTSSLEETVFRNNLEAADEIARQLRLRDIGGIIVIDFIDMEIRENRQKVIERLPRRAGPRQDPHAGVRHLRARPGRDDPQAHRRGPARVVRRDRARTARAAASSSTTT